MLFEAQIRPIEHRLNALLKLYFLDTGFLSWALKDPFSVPIPK
jgi:hypothetical protein